MGGERRGVVEGGERAREVAIEVRQNAKLPPPERPALICQYLYFCTSKASKLSTCRAPLRPCKGKRRRGRAARTGGASSSNTTPSLERHCSVAAVKGARQLATSSAFCVRICTLVPVKLVN